MVKISSYVFIDIETTGLPYQERNRTKITEISLVAVLRKDLEKATIGDKPYVGKLTLLLNPERKIATEVEVITGISNDMVKNAPIFKEKSESILSFIKELPKPICLVAHNGYNFDYKILLAEFNDINIALPNDLLCVDSLVGYRKMHKQNYAKVTNNNFSFEDSRGSEDWPDLNITAEDWNEIDILCSSLSDVDLDSSRDSISKDSSPLKEKIVKENLSFKLPDIYKRLYKKDPIEAHRAEADCLMLLECVVASKEFLIWTDKYCKHIFDIKALERR